MKSKSLVDFSKYEKALASLEAALSPPPANDRERDGAIQRFDYTFEITWKIAKIVLTVHGIDTQSPRNIFRELARVGWINNPEVWFEFLEARNKTSHNYREEIATSVFAVIPKFSIEAAELLKVLKRKSKE